jgi:2-polyprenyl-3-methyl-5-hydroxy-6-metoxy-1,4-benzoquinol methylase
MYEVSINSKEWWENEFLVKNNWETGIDGKIQTDFFAQISYSLINPTIKKDIKKLEGTFIDFGCALGQATQMLRVLNDKAAIVGIEIAEEALKKAKELFPDVKFENNLDKIEKASLIYASNVLEHYKSPKDILNQLLDKSEKYVIVLVPYEQKANELHEIEFKENTLKNLIWDKPEWILIQETVIGATDNFYSPVKQVLGIYKKIF